METLIIARLPSEKVLISLECDDLVLFMNVLPPPVLVSRVNWVDVSSSANDTLAELEHPVLMDAPPAPPAVPLFRIRLLLL